MTSRLFFSSAAALALLAVPAAAQPGCALTAEPARITVKRTENPEYRLRLKLPPGCHTNSHQPNDPDLIPLRLTWNPGPLEAGAITFPKPTLEKYSFSEKPLSVFSGEFEIVTQFTRKPTAMPGPAVLGGKLRYQACNDRMCFPPRTIEIKAPVMLQ
ncbi:MAG: hypothetical protein KJZ84_01465 [Bryobacteraceae bacterium]|nr:hypothetical protein [Bryobacteraceae bacterium]